MSKGMVCSKCHRPIKEDKDGDERYCQGHSVMENVLFGEEEE